jgi:hypothetical protein
MGSTMGAERHSPLANIHYSLATDEATGLLAQCVGGDVVEKTVGGEGEAVDRVR